MKLTDEVRIIGVMTIDQGPAALIGYRADLIIRSDHQQQQPLRRPVIESAGDGNSCAPTPDRWLNS